MYSIGWIVTSLLNIKTEDCSVIAIEIICKTMGLLLFVLSANSLKRDIKLPTEFPSAVLLMTSLILLTHLLLKKIGYATKCSYLEFKRGFLMENIFRSTKNNMNSESIERNELPFTITKKNIPIEPIFMEKISKK